MKNVKIKILFFLTLALWLVIFPAWNEDTWSQSFKKISPIISIIRDNYFKDVDQEELVYSSIKGMIQTLDPHSYFLGPDHFSRLIEEQEGKYYGLGIMIQKQEDRLVVISPVEGSPAYRMGITPGDIISHVNGESTKPLTSYEAMQKLRGPKGTEVRITIVREGMERPFELTIVREEIPLYSVPYAFILQDDIGYIYIRSFGGTTTREFREKVEDLSRKGMKKLILDMRTNSGGAFLPAVEISDEFLPKGTVIVTIRGRNKGYYREFRAGLDNQYEKLPLVILINRGSASAPEILSGAIRDNDRGLIVGEDSFGKGLVQQVFTISGNNKAAVALTIAKYYTPSGMSIQRDYTNLDEWMLHKEPPEEKREVRYTSKGRKILGQGGISPDYKVEISAHRLTVDLLISGSFFSYGRKFAGKITALREKQNFLPQNKQAEEPEKGKVTGSEFAVDDRVLEDFKEYLKANKVEFGSDDFEKAKEEIRRELEREIISSIWGIEEGVKAYRKSDPVVLKAIEALPKASSLIDTF